jgi:transcriptional regulator GlxA family with amidase domain
VRRDNVKRREETAWEQSAAVIRVRLIQDRIDHAKQLMSQTSMSLIDIAIQSGFNQAAFTRTFHQLVGVSPEDGDGIT